MAVKVTTSQGYIDPVIKRADGFSVEAGNLQLFAGGTQVAVYAPDFWYAATILIDPETPDRQL